MKNLRKLFSDILSNLRWKKLWKRVLTGTAAAVVFITIYMLILPAVAIDKKSAEETPGIYLNKIEDGAEILDGVTADPAVNGADGSVEMLSADPQTATGAVVTDPQAAPGDTAADPQAVQDGFTADEQEYQIVGGEDFADAYYAADENVEAAYDEDEELWDASAQDPAYDGGMVEEAQEEVVGQEASYEYGYDEADWSLEAENTEDASLISEGVEDSGWISDEEAGAIYEDGTEDSGWIADEEADAIYGEDTGEDWNAGDELEDESFYGEVEDGIEDGETLSGDEDAEWLDGEALIDGDDWASDDGEGGVPDETGEEISGENGEALYEEDTEFGEVLDGTDTAEDTELTDPEQQSGDAIVENGEEENETGEDTDPAQADDAEEGLTENENGTEDGLPVEEGGAGEGLPVEESGTEENPAKAAENPEESSSPAAGELSAEYNGTVIRMIFDDAAAIPEGSVLYMSEYDPENPEEKEFYEKYAELANQAFLNEEGEEDWSVSGTRVYAVRVEDSEGRSLQIDAHRIVELEFPEEAPLHCGELRAALIRQDENGEENAFLLPVLAERNDDNDATECSFEADDLSVFCLVWNDAETYYNSEGNTESNTESDENADDVETASEEGTEDDGEAGGELENTEESLNENETAPEELTDSEETAEPAETEEKDLEEKEDEEKEASSEEGAEDAIDAETDAAAEKADSSETSAASQTEPSDKKDENAEKAEETVYPAQTFSEKADSGVKVQVYAGEGAFPAGTTMTVEDVDDEDTIGTITDFVEKEVSRVKAVNITFYDKDGNEIEPKKEIRVVMSAEESDKTEEIQVVHVDNDGNPETVEDVNVIERNGVARAQIVEPGKEGDEESAPSEETGAETEDANPENAEIFDESENSEAGENPGSEESDTESVNEEALSEAWEEEADFAEEQDAFEEEIGEEIEEETAEEPEETPEEDFGETVSEEDYSGQDEAAANDDISEEAAGDVIEEITDITGNEEDVTAAEESAAGFDENEEAVASETEVEFTADEFSIYAMVYTVDFHWEVDGKIYDFSIPGGGFVSLQHLVEALGITGETNSAENEADDVEKSASETYENITEAAPLTLDNVVVSEETRQFVADVENVNFSNSELLWVGKVDADSTVGRLKEVNRLECEYSAELTEEQIAEINAQTVTAGDWAIISMLPFDTEESLTVTMKNGEQFVVRITDARDPLGLDGRSFSIVNYRNNTWYALRGERNTTTQNNRGYYLFADSVSHTNANNTEYCGIEADAWLFEYNADEDAYYVSCNGMYLYIDPTITSKNDSNPNNNYAHALDLKAEKDQSDKGTLLKISRDADGNYIFKSYSEKITLWDYGSNTYWLSNESQETGNEYLNSHMRLCLPEDSGSNASHKATLISAADTQPGQKIIIYQRVLDPTTDTFTYYAINGKGGMEKVYNSSDSVYWKGDLNIEWTLTDLGNGYCTLYNEKENTYLTPKASKGTDNSFVVHKASDFDGSKHLSISLPGRDDGTYTSLISCWDYVDNATYGLKASETTGGGQVAIEPLLTSQPFYFAARDPIVHDQLTTVDTVDSVSKGIKITMYDWGNELGLDSHRQKWDASDWNNEIIQDRLPMMQNIMGASDSYADKYESGMVKPGILANYIDEGQTAPNILNENGTGNGHNLSELFSNTYIRTGTTAEKVNHLFLQSVYDETGFFKYSCFENYAYLANGNDFTVYEQIGTPSNRTVNDYQKSNIIFERGNFMPYNPINAAMNYRQNNYDPDLKELPAGDPRKGERLYYIENAFSSGNVNYNGTWFQGNSNPEAYANYYLGMKVEAKFSQNPGGYADNGDPMVFEFNGDDDLWIYLDNVLVLDMGGVHDAFRGKINFRTGDVTCNALNGESTTIKEMFKNANRFPDGTVWDDNRVNEYFRGNTFKDFTTHNFKMFYMERGASASDLEMMFNLPVLTESQFRIKKELPETNDGEAVQSQYGDAPFYYKAYVYDADTGSMVPCTRQYLNSKGLDAPRYEGDGEVEWLDADPNQEIFLVKPGQTAVFPAIDDSVRWYTVEVAPPQNLDMLNKFSVSNSDQDNDTNYEVGVKSKERTILVRNLVIYQNRPDDELVNELQIKKKINGNAYNENDAFEYRIYLEKTDGKLGVYRLGEYYQFDKDNNFVFYESGVRHTAKMEVLSNGQYRYYNFDDGRAEETVDVQKITEHTSTNGSVGDVRDGDTIIIKGLLVGTDFYVYERTDYDYMSPDSTPAEGKYVFEGTDVTDAYTRNPETNKPKNELIFNSLYGLPDTEAINSYSHSDYEREKAASGAIIEHKDAKILVKNKPYVEIPEGTIIVQKKWLDEGGHDITSTVTDKSITYDIYRLVHVHDLELVVDEEPTDTEPGQQHYKCKHDGCNFELPAEQISPNGHQWSEWERTQRPTCEEDGIWERYCLNPDCNETETWTEPAIGHDWDNGTITREATTTQTGIRHHVCQNDSSHIWDEEIPKLAGNIRYHIRSMYNHDSSVTIGSYGSDGTIPAGTGNAIRVSYTLKSTYPDEKWAYGGSEQSIGRTEKYINYNYYYDYSVIIPIEEGKELYLYMEPGANSNRSNFKIEAIEYYGANSLSAVSKQQAVMHNVLGKVKVRTQKSASNGPTNNAELNDKLARIGYSETDEQTHAVVNHNFYQWEKYDSASQSWKTDGVSTETLQNGNWSKSYTVPLTDDDGNPYEYYFIEKSINPESETAHWTTTYTGQDGGMTAAGTVTINNQKVPESGSLLITKNVTYNGSAQVPADKQSYVNKDYKFAVTKDGAPIDQSPITISVSNGASNKILIDNLEPGNYEIIETDSAGLRLTGFSGGTTQNSEKKSVTVTVTAGKTTEDQLEESAKATFVNDYSETSITLKKIDKADLNADNPDLLKGASFTITKYKTVEFREIDKAWGENGLKTLSDEKDEETDIYTLNGSFTFTDLPAGYYMIEETAFPDGYIKLNHNPRIEIGEDMKVYLLDSEGQRVSDNATEIIRVIPVTETQQNNIIRIGNEPGAALPNTGGPGTRIFTILGSILLLGAEVLLWRIRRTI